MSCVNQYRAIRGARRRPSSLAQSTSGERRADHLRFHRHIVQFPRPFGLLATIVYHENEGHEDHESHDGCYTD
jgi:hypothetical protein